MAILNDDTSRTISQAQSQPSTRITPAESSLPADGQVKKVPLNKSKMVNAADRRSRRTVLKLDQLADDPEKLGLAKVLKIRNRRVSQPRAPFAAGNLKPLVPTGFIKMHKAISLPAVSQNVKPRPLKTMVEPPSQVRETVMGTHLLRRDLDALTEVIPGCAGIHMPPKHIIDLAYRHMSRLIEEVQTMKRMDFFTKDRRWLQAQSTPGPNP